MKKEIVMLVGWVDKADTPDFVKTYNSPQVKAFKELYAKFIEKYDYFWIGKPERYNWKEINK